MPDDSRPDLYLLRRVQELHDATLRRHGEMLDRLDDAVDRHESRLQALADLAARQQTLLETLTQVASALQQTLAAIKDMLERGNGH